MQAGQQLHQGNGARGTDGMATRQSAAPGIDALRIQPLRL